MQMANTVLNTIILLEWFRSGHCRIAMEAGVWPPPTPWHALTGPVRHAIDRRVYSPTARVCLPSQYSEMVSYSHRSTLPHSAVSPSLYFTLMSNLQAEPPCGNVIFTVSPSPRASLTMMSLPQELLEACETYTLSI